MKQPAAPGSAEGEVDRVSRPRATRAFMTRRRAALLSLFLVAASVPVGGYLTGDRATQAAIADVFRDPLAVLSGRSPGERGAGAMFQTKPSKERKASLLTKADGPAGAPGAPSERVLPVVRERPAEPEVFPLADPGAPQVPFGDPELQPFADPDPLLDPPGTTTSTSTSGGPQASTSSTGGNPPPADPPPAVPEPATWLMMILGFGAIGAALRRRKLLEGNARLAADTSAARG